MGMYAYPRGKPADRPSSCSLFYIPESYPESCFVVWPNFYHYILDAQFTVTIVIHQELRSLRPMIYMIIIAICVSVILWCAAAPEHPD